MVPPHLFAVPPRGFPGARLHHERRARRRPFSTTSTELVDGRRSAGASSWNVTDAGADAEKTVNVGAHPRPRPVDVRSSKLVEIAASRKNIRSSRTGPPASRSHATSRLSAAQNRPLS
jgi:hypothetical protein